MWLGRADVALERGRISAGLLRRLSRRVHDPLDDHGSASWMIDSVSDPSRHGERVRPVAGHPHLDPGGSVTPIQLEVLLVPAHLAAVHEVLDHHDRPFELGHLDRLLTDDAACGVSPADPHHHATVRDVVQRRVSARENRRLARSGIRDTVPELHRARRLRGEREQRERLLPEQIGESYVHPYSKP